MRYLFPRQILYLHRRIIEKTGGSPEVRDLGRLEAAVYRPQATFGGQDLYPDLFSKAAALGHSLIQNHPMLDGNKRLGLEAMRLMLRLNGHDLATSQEEKYDFTLRVATGQLDAPAMAQWLENRSVPYKTAG